MSRYIEVNVVLDEFGKEFKNTKKLIEGGETHLDTLAEGYTECHLIVEHAPTADVVEVVRCKDCKHWSDYIHPIAHTATCFALSVFDKIQTNSEQWCCYGERKEE